MKYVGIQSQISRNNFKSVLLLILFPVILCGLVWVGIMVAVMAFSGSDSVFEDPYKMSFVNETFLQALPWVLGITLIWFLIAYYSNASMIKSMSGAQPLERRDNMRVYNIVENLCMSIGMEMPKLYVIDDPQLNAFASGINQSTYAVTVTTGLLNKLNDAELEGVIAHELTHIRNRDTRLLITSIIFVGIFTFLMQMSMMLLRGSLWRGTRSRNSKDSGGAAIIMLLIVLVLSAIGYFFTLVTRFALSRRREYMADAGAVELTHDSRALASALRKIRKETGLQSIADGQIAQLFIANPKQKAVDDAPTAEELPPLPQMAYQLMSQEEIDDYNRRRMASMHAHEDGNGSTSELKRKRESLFSTHPPIENRIIVLEQF